MEFKLLREDVLPDRVLRIYAMEIKNEGCVVKTTTEFNDGRFSEVWLG